MPAATKIRGCGGSVTQGSEIAGDPFRTPPSAADLALWAGLSNVMDAGWAALIVAAVWGVIAAVLYVRGRSAMHTVNPKPERTVETVREVPGALKGH